MVISNRVLEMLCILLVVLAFKQITPIPCDFQFEEVDPHYRNNLLEIVTLGKLRTTTTVAPQVAFHCEDQEDDNSNFNDGKSNQTRGGDDRFLFSNPDESDYEDQESSCHVSRRSIQPKALNNIYNKLTKVVNTGSFVQSINIEQCLNRRESCNSAVVPPSGSKHICRQKFVRITLKAHKDDEHGVIVDEQFYYPSHCVCELVTIKTTTRRKTKCRLV